MSKADAFSDMLILATFGNGFFSIPDPVYVALHTADPGPAGDQSTNEADFGGYARQPLNKITDWNINTNQAANASDVVFPAATGAGTTVTHWSLGAGVTGAGALVYRAPLSTPVPIASGTIVRINAGNLTVQET